MRYIYCPAGRSTWADAAIRLKEFGYLPCIWLGDPVHDKFAQKNFAGCTVLDFYRLNLGRIDGSRYNKGVFDTSVNNKPFFEELMVKTFDMMNRQDPLGRYEFETRKQVFYALVLYFIDLLEQKKPQFALFSEAAHSPAQFILYSLCRRQHITTVEFSSGPYVFPVMTLKIDGVRRAIRDHVSAVEKAEIGAWIKRLGQDYKKAAPNYTAEKDHSIARYFTKLIYKYCKESLKKIFDQKVNPTYMIKNCVDGCRAMSRYEWKLKKRLLAKEARIRRSYFTYVSKRDIAQDKFVYFPLHYQPERTSNPEGGQYYDQFQALAKLRSLLGDDVGIYIKEHPAQFWPNRNGGCARNQDYYRNLNSIGGIRFVDTTQDSFELVDGSLFVATITGTVGVEAAARGKPVLVFGDPWYRGMPGSIHIEEIDHADVLAGFLKNAKNHSRDQLVEFIYGILSSSLYGTINPSNERYLKKFMNHRVQDDGRSIAALINSIMSPEGSSG